MSRLPLSPTQPAPSPTPCPSFWRSQNLRIGLSLCAIFTGSLAAFAQPAIPTESQSTLQRAGADALKAEKRRDRLDACARVLTDAQGIACVAREYGLTQENYAAYTHSISGLLRLKFKDDTNTGPTVLDVVHGFETAEALWLRVRDLQCAAVNDQTPGDHPAADQICQLYLTRRHIYDLQVLYPDLWNK
jgi:hypothetical protein